MAPTFTTFKDFYPYYLQQHQNPVCRWLHVAGLLATITLASTFIFTGNLVHLLWLPALGYGLSWIGHFFFEKNKPATFGYPLYSLLGDLVMVTQTLTGTLPSHASPPTAHNN